MTLIDDVQAKLSEADLYPAPRGFKLWDWREDSEYVHVEMSHRSTRPGATSVSMTLDNCVEKMRDQMYDHDSSQWPRIRNLDWSYVMMHRDEFEGTFFELAELAGKAGYDRFEWKGRIYNIEPKGVVSASEYGVTASGSISHLRPSRRVVDPEIAESIKMLERAADNSLDRALVNLASFGPKLGSVVDELVDEIAALRRSNHILAQDLKGAQSWKKKIRAEVVFYNDEIHYTVVKPWEPDEPVTGRVPVMIKNTVEWERAEQEVRKRLMGMHVFSIEVTDMRAMDISERDTIDRMTGERAVDRRKREAAA